MDAKKVIYQYKYCPSITISRLGKAAPNRNEKCAKEVIAGKYGVNPARVENLKKAGYDPDVIQSIVNDMVNGVYIQKNDRTNIMMSNEVKSILQSMQFSLSKSDIAGSFSITLFPETTDGEMVFDKLKIMDIVEIYEPTSVNNRADRPVFTGIIKNKKVSSQVVGDSGARRVTISGTAITGLVSQFLINLDTSAMAITKQYVNDTSIAKDLTIKNLGKKGLKVKDVVSTIWEYFLKISSQNGTPRIAEYISSLIGGIGDIFKFDDSEFFYPLGCIFKGQQTQDFFSVVDGVIPSPVYEKFAFTDGTGKMRIAIRQCPFDADKWSGGTAANRYKIENILVKGFDFSKSDNEVYTVFYAYLQNSPIDENRSLILSTMEAKQDSVLVDSEKYDTYGYRPLIAHFIGYTKPDGKEDTESQNKLKELSEKLKNWYEHLPDMLTGSITMAMSYQNTIAIMPGDIVLFLGCEFYVEGITHSWNYGAGGEITISVSRGGKYNNGKFADSDTQDKLEIGKLSLILEGVK